MHFFPSLLCVVPVSPISFSRFHFAVVVFSPRPRPGFAARLGRASPPPPREMTRQDCKIVDCGEDFSSPLLSVLGVFSSFLSFYPLLSFSHILQFSSCVVFFFLSLLYNFFSSNASSVFYISSPFCSFILFSVIFLSFAFFLCYFSFPFTLSSLLLIVYFLLFYSPFCLLFNFLCPSFSDFLILWFSFLFSHLYVPHQMFSLCSPSLTMISPFLSSLFSSIFFTTHWMLFPYFPFFL